MKGWKLSFTAVSLFHALYVFAFSPVPVIKSRVIKEKEIISSRISLFNEVREDEITSLPIYSILDEIRDALGSKPNLLLEASPGAGKTTIVPLFLSSEYSNVVVLEPRRVATRSAAQRMASLVNQTPGQGVGYAIRGESRTSSKTRVTVMTDGVLLNKLRKDPELSGVDVVILDEFHERGIGSDTALALCREVQVNFRPDLKIVVMSATLLGDVNTDSSAVDNKDESTGSKLLRVLGGAETCNLLQSEGRQFPITVKHATRSSPLHGALLADNKLLVRTMADAIEEGLLRAPSKGDVLAFLPGAKEIKRVVQELRSRRLSGNIEIFQMYGALPKEEQDRAIKKKDRSARRIIVSSPIAEASLTIEGVTCVVDSGFRREPRFSVSTGLPRLVTVKCSQDSAIQRAGRAGRVEDGVCIRLFSEGEFARMPQHSMPEILSTDLAPTALLLSDWGCSSVEEILNDVPFVDSPPEDSLMKAYNMLIDLEAIQEYKVPDSNQIRFRVTSHGKRLSQLNTHPRLASSIVRSAELGSVHLVAAITVAAIVDEELGSKNQEPNLRDTVRYVLNSGMSSFEGEKVLQYASRIGSNAKHTVEATMAGDINVGQVTEALGEALLPGFIDLIAQRKGDASYGGSTYMLSLGQSARLDNRRDEGEYIIVVDTSTGDDDKTRIRSYANIDLKSLLDVAEETDEVYTVASAGYEVRARKVVKVGSLQLSSSPLPSPSPEKVTEALFGAIALLGGVGTALMQNQSKKNLAAISELRHRVRLARQLSNDEEWPQCFTALDAIDTKSGKEKDEDELKLLVEPWLSAAGSIKAIDFLQILQASLAADQERVLNQCFPTKIKAPDETSVPLSYDAGKAPLASAKLQQFFGATESPCVGYPHNSIPITLSLLSPSGKPLAQTIDLPFFWKQTYPAVRAEMRGRYPKHPWPEDPMKAEPTRLLKKQQELQSTFQDGAKMGDKRKERSKQRKTKKRS